MWVHARACTCTPEVQKRALDLQDLEVKSVNSILRMLGTKLDPVEEQQVLLPLSHFSTPLREVMKTVVASGIQPNL